MDSANAYRNWSFLAHAEFARQVNDPLPLDTIPPEGFDYRLGNRSAIRSSTNIRRAIESPRRPATSPATPTIPTNSETIVRLAGQIVRVSIETVKLVNSLPAEYAPPTS